MACLAVFCLLVRAIAFPGGALARYYNVRRGSGPRRVSSPLSAFMGAMLGFILSGKSHPTGGVLGIPSLPPFC